jgi:hypothetical protein
VGVSSAIQRPCTGLNYSICVIGPWTAVTIVGALGISTEPLVWLGRSRILGRIGDQPEQKEKDVYELSEILDAYDVFRTLSGKYKDMGLPGDSLRPRQSDVAPSSERISSN